MHAALRTRLALDDSEAVREKCVEDLMQTLDIQREGITLKDAMRGMELLKWWDVETEVMRGYKDKAKTRWEKATAFE